MKTLLVSTALLSMLGITSLGASAGSYTVTADDAIIQSYMASGRVKAAQQTPQQAVQAIVDRAMMPYKQQQADKDKAAACAAMKQKTPADPNVAKLCP